MVEADRPESVSTNTAWPSPARLMRSLSNNGSSTTNGTSNEARNGETTSGGKPEAQAIDPLSQVSCKKALVLHSKNLYTD